MPLFTLTESCNISIYYDSENDWLYAEWHGNLTADRIQLCYEDILTYLEATQCTRVLNDNSTLVSIHSDPGTWLATDWFPRAFQHGLKRFAWVYPSTIASRFSVQNLMQYSSHPHIVCFDDLATACTWLQDGHETLTAQKQVSGRSLPLLPQHSTFTSHGLSNLTH